MRLTVESSLYTYPTDVSGYLEFLQIWECLTMLYLLFFKK